MNNTLTNIVTIMGLLGIPSIFALVTWCFKKVRDVINTNKQRDEKMNSDIKMLMKAHQVQLRRNLVEDYIKYKKMNCITIDDLDLFEAQYTSYHSLGENGVMDRKHEEMLNLPIVEHYPVIRSSEEDDGK